MPMPTTLVVRYRVMTPAFLGGADIINAELRPPSIKAALRFWYRAVDPEFATRVNGAGDPVRESHLFGATEHGAGQSKVMVSVVESRVQPMAADRMDWDEFAEGRGRRVKNGLSYLGYPLRPRRDGVVRTALVPGSTFGVRLLIRPFVPRRDDDGDRGRAAGHRLTEREARGLVAAAWLLGHVGGLGARSRRGFGTLAIDSWHCEGPDATVLDAARAALPLGRTLAHRDAWTQAWTGALATFRTWFGVRDHAVRLDNPHLGPRARAEVMARRFAIEAWPAAMDSAGRVLQDFRALRQPDYDTVKAHLLLVARAAGGAEMRTAPPRVAFGLPLTFRFGSLSTRPADMTFVPFPRDEGGQAAERMGSLLFLRLIALGDGLHPAFFRLDGAVPGFDTPVGQRVRGGRPLPPPTSNALDAFMTTLEKP